MQEFTEKSHTIGKSESQAFGILMIQIKLSLTAFGIYLKYYLLKINKYCLVIVVCDKIIGRCHLFISFTLLFPI